MSSSFRRRPLGKTSPFPNASIKSKASNTFSNESHPAATTAGAPPPPVPPLPTPTTTVLERKGTKPWMGGLTLTSFGLRELDAIIGGGQPLETVVLIEEDRWTQDLALALARYWCAEAVSQQQLLSLVATQPDISDQDLDMLDNDTHKPNDFPNQGISSSDCQSFLHLLPRDLHLDKETKRESAAVDASASAASTTNKETDMKARQSSATISKQTLQSVKQAHSQPFAIIEENEEDDDFEDADDTATTQEKLEDGLQNAWQYKLSIQQERSGQVSTNTHTKKSQSKIYCHSYDLSGKMMDQHPAGWVHTNERISIADCICSCPIQLFQKCLTEIQQQLAKHPDGVVRLLLLNAPIRMTAVMLPLLLSYIRANSLPVIILITIRPWYCTSLSTSQTSSTLMPSLLSLRRTCDASFTCEGFDAFASKPPPEFSDLAGIFSIRKTALQSLSHFCDSTTNRRPPANRYGMKRDRRKVHIRMLHLPPEDFSAGGSSVGSGARSGAGRSSSSSSSKQESGRGQKTALEAGLSCATHRRPGKSNASSLDF